jgi:hypothetical protein
MFSLRQGELKRMANISGTVQINNISDGDMVKIYEFKEKHNGDFTFQLSTSGPQGNQILPHITLSWTKIEGAEAVVQLMKELQPKA